MAVLRFPRVPLFLAVVGTLAFVRAAAAQPSPFAPDPDWTGPEEATEGVALGDMDGDGDLDLVRANAWQGFTLYLNTGGTFAATPARTVTWTYARGKVALGDVDKDGDLDVVLSDYWHGSVLYLNTGGNFALESTRGGPEEHTADLALGDVDGDGDLDLIRGNYDSGATLHLYTGGTFSRVIAWNSQVSEGTSGVALGDVDGDGDLDLVCGNYNMGSTLYLNSGGRFESTPAWTGPPELLANTVALGDMDGDGDLDLVMGAGNAPVLFLNVDGRFGSNPNWSGQSDYSLSVSLGDVDGDGDLDLVTGGYGSTRLYINNLNLYGNLGYGVWNGPAMNTYSVALGDVDGDGDLDLVRGNSNESATLHLNHSGFGSGLYWSGPNTYSPSLAVVDVDGDSDLDLVTGGWYQGATVHLNKGALFDPVPAWTGPIEHTLSVAFGDVDGDGDPDMAHGNQDQPSTLYLNTGGGSFESTASWTMPPLGYWGGLAFGDMNGDGHSDLVTGRDSAALYVSNGTNLETVPTWLGRVENTVGVALGDVDGDGRLDLVRANSFGGSTVARNLGGGSFLPIWVGPDNGTTRNVAFGDVDGDGDLDLVCSTRLYLNNGPTFNQGAIFEGAPAWRGIENDNGCVLGDTDGDGDLDLILGSRLYVNNGGSFGPNPSWTGSDYSDTQANALGDLDADGDLDLVRSDYTGIRVHLHSSPWLRTDFVGDITKVVSTLPNNAAHLRRVRAAPAGPNRMKLGFETFDAESDPLWISGQYQLEATGDWHPMDLVGTYPKVGPLTTSPGGIAHEVEWDIARLPFDRRNIVIRLRADSPPRKVGTVQFIPNYVLNVGHIAPERPGLAAEPVSLSFPTVTVGDSVALTLHLSNPGNRDLVIHQVDSPDPEVKVGFTADLTIPPGQSRELEVMAAPTVLIYSPGPVRIHSNDPILPVLNVPLLADVRLLTFETRLLATAPELPLGEAATVVITPGPDVHLERGWVFFRARGDTVFADSAALTVQGPNFAALVPGASVTESGLEYYVRVENSGVFAVDPPNAPYESHFYPVAPPVGITSAVQSDARGRYPSARATPVVVTMPPGASLESGELFFRAGGAAVWDSVELAPIEIVPGTTLPGGMIPAESVGPRGVEYWVRVHTHTSVLTDPPGEPTLHPRSLVTDVPDVEESAGHAGSVYRMVSIPLDLDLPDNATLEDLVKDEADFGAYDPLRWRVFRWLPDAGSYAEISSANAETGELRPEPGRAFWLIARDANRIDTKPVAGLSVSTSDPQLIRLEPGWNQVGVPFLFPVAWSAVSAEGPSGPVTLEPPVAWEEAQHSYQSSDVIVLEPFTGYWVRNPTDEVVDLIVPPTEASSVPVPAAPAPRDAMTWQVQIAASAGEATDARNVAGVAAGALEGLDALDRTEPPVSPGTALSLYFVESEHGTKRTVDVRPPVAESGDASSQGRRWSFDVALEGAGDAPAAVKLEVTGAGDVPSGLEIWLIDRAMQRTIDLRQQPNYAFVYRSSGDSRLPRFELVIGTPAFVAKATVDNAPKTTQMLPCYPNPATSQAILRFDLARREPVRIEAFDLAGRKIRTLVDETRDAGRYEEPWALTDGTGRALPGGVYLLRFAAPGRTQVQKLLKTP